MVRAIVRVLTTCLLWCLMHACTAPQIPSSFTGPIVRVAVVDGTDWTAWRGDQREAIEHYLPTLSEVGVRFVVSERADADLEVRTFDAGICSQTGLYTAGDSFVRVDPACAHSEGELLFVVGHEVLHFTTWRELHWLGHVCTDTNTGERCHPTLRGESLLNPHVPNDANPRPTALDRQLFRGIP